MDCAGNQESKSAVISSIFSMMENICADATFRQQSSLADALPTSHRDTLEFDNLEAQALPPSSSVLDWTADGQATNPSAMPFGCSPPLGTPGAHPNMHAMLAEMHVPYSVSTVEGPCLSGIAASHALCRSCSNVCFSSENDFAHLTSPANTCMLKASASRLEFMQSFLNTLLPELERIHSQSPPTSLLEKCSAVRLAADMSLATSAWGNNTWSQALIQELTSSSYSNVRPRRKSNVRKSNRPRGGIYASILRRSSLKGGSHSKRLQTHTSHSKGPSAFAYFSVLRDLSPSTPGLSGSCVREMKHAKRKRQSGLVSYVKILRNCRSRRSVKPPAGLRSQASKAYAPFISKEHIASLGRLVPGGQKMDVPLLFQEAADYILSLQMQVQALQSLSRFVS